MPRPRGGIAQRHDISQRVAGPPAFEQISYLPQHLHLRSGQRFVGPVELLEFFLVERDLCIGAIHGSCHLTLEPFQRLDAGGVIKLAHCTQTPAQKSGFSDTGM
jgi:hypothetical protein